MKRDIVAPTIVEESHSRKDEVVHSHPAYGMIAASRVSSNPGAVLFDSDIRHGHYVTVKIETCTRHRNLMRDWFFGRKRLIEVAMSEAQWASFVSSMNTSGVPCTITARENDPFIPELPYEPRLRESMDEVTNAASKATERIEAAFAEVQEVFDGNGGKKAMREALHSLRHAMGSVRSNMKFAGDSLEEHAENVVQKARVDIEAMVLSKAEQIGLENPQEIVRELTEGDDATP